MPLRATEHHLQSGKEQRLVDFEITILEVDRMPIEALLRHQIKIQYGVLSGRGNPPIQDLRCT